jgi:hypothetical protein
MVGRAEETKREENLAAFIASGHVQKDTSEMTLA